MDIREHLEVVIEICKTALPVIGELDGFRLWVRVVARAEEDLPEVSGDWARTWWEITNEYLPETTLEQSREILYLSTKLAQYRVHEDLLREAPANAMQAGYWSEQWMVKARKAVAEVLEK